MAAPDGYEPRHLQRTFTRWSTTLPNGLTVRPGSLSSWPSTDYTTATTGNNTYSVGIPLASTYVGKHR